MQDTNLSMDSVNDVSTILNERLAAIDFQDASLHLLLGYHQSDIGKAHLIARLARLLAANSTVSILKFDGFLNTNQHGQHPSRTRNDFVVYRQFLEHIAFGGAHLILSGPLLAEFLNEFGESQEHLMFCPHVAKYFARRIFDNWRRLAEPKHLFFEIGGNVLDDEVQIYVLPAIRILRARVKRFHVMLLAEAGFNREVVKVRPIINALASARRSGFAIDTLFVRLPATVPASSDYRVLGLHIKDRIEQSLVSSNVPEVVCIPYYEDEALSGYTDYLAGYIDTIFAARKQHA